MSKRGAIPLMVLGAGALGAGIWLLRDANHYHYAPSDSRMAIGACAAGALLFGGGVARRTRWFALPIVAAIALAYPLIAWRGYAVDGAALEASRAAAAALDKAATVVCDGTPVPAAAAVAPHGLRPSLWIRLGEDHYIEPVDAAWKAADLATAQLVICATMSSNALSPCEYEGAVTVGRNRIDLDLTVREAKTATIVATRRFDGEEPSCLDAIKMRKGAVTHSDFNGLSPMASAWKPWLTAQVVAP